MALGGVRVSDWMLGGPGRRQQPEVGYDVMQVCLNGHQITDVAETFPHQRKQFCPSCGERTIDACPECNAPIQGHLKGVLSQSTDVPNNCHNCGTAYPWRQGAIANAIEVVQMEMDAADAASVPELVQMVTIEAPRTQVAALKLKMLLGKLGKPAYDISIHVLSDLMSETAKKTFGMKP
jgi:hypothetical protein